MCVPMKCGGRWLCDVCAYEVVGGGCVMCVPMKCEGRWLCDVCAYEV